MPSFVGKIYFQLYRFRNGIGLILFCLSLLLIGKIYDYPTILPLKPQGIHTYRQSDCLSIANCYYYDDLPFCKPSLQNQIGDLGENGYSAGEFPLLYFTVAKIWKVTGYNLSYYRGLNTLIVFLGLTCLFLFLRSLLSSNTWSMGICWLTISSPVIAYYACNYLTNATAFGLTLIGNLFFYNYSRGKHWIYLCISFLVITLAGLLKISSLIPAIAIISLWICQELKWFNVHQTRLVRHRWIMIFGILFMLAGILSWYRYAAYYNNIHRAAYTFNDITPIWRISGDEIREIGATFWRRLISQWYHKSILLCFALMYVYILLSIRKVSANIRPAIVFLVLMTLGSIIYLLLWFQLISFHDYYMIEVVPLWVSLLAVFAMILRDRAKEFYSGFLSKPVFLLLVGFSLFYGKKMMDFRYHKFKFSEIKGYPLLNAYETDYWSDLKFQYYTHIFHLQTLDIWLDNHGYSRQDRILYLSDNSISIPFVMAGRKGNNLYGLAGLSLRERIEFCKSKGTRILLLDDSAPQLQDPTIRDYLQDTVGRHGSIIVFRI